MAHVLLPTPALQTTLLHALVRQAPLLAPQVVQVLRLPVLVARLLVQTPVLKSLLSVPHLLPLALVPLLMPSH